MIDRETFDIRAFGIQVARHLPGWTPVAQEEDRRERFCLANGAYEIELFWSKYASRDDLERVKISVNHWPEYTEHKSGNEYKQRVGPWDLYNPKETAPRITVAIARGAAVVAKEITRRVLPEYERIYKRCAERTIEAQAYQDQTRDGWAAICAALGKDAKRQHHYVRIGADSTRLEVEHYSGGRGRVKVDVDARELAAILAALRKQEVA